MNVLQVPSLSQVRRSVYLVVKHKSSHVSVDEYALFQGMHRKALKLKLSLVQARWLPYLESGEKKKKEKESVVTVK